MKSAGRRIQGVIGMSLAWGAVWGAAGGLVARVPGFNSDLPFPLLLAPFGIVYLFSAPSGPRAVERGLIW
ncbi:hypothetical protein PX52LOC_05704 [Limnoglobus roseus]|uniref:Uncharacterized protein n=1 Tax=Limnoglobus roseus TaxID=2598579 RepID=A0A5C1AIJ2_9BACT|nr:hypothetical protein PX52LOC_05704 [Limnoglobus roseus]